MLTLFGCTALAALVMMFKIWLGAYLGWAQIHQTKLDPLRSTCTHHVACDALHQ